MTMMIHPQVSMTVIASNVLFQPCWCLSIAVNQQYTVRPDQIIGIAGYAAAPAGRIAEGEVG
jgi:hypothetical protein